VKLEGGVSYGSESLRVPNKLSCLPDPSRLFLNSYNDYHLLLQSPAAICLRFLMHRMLPCEEFLVKNIKNDLSLISHTVPQSSKSEPL
jgi:hypothetical protein